MSEKKILWKKIYTLVLIFNALYMVIFYLITQMFDS